MVDFLIVGQGLAGSILSYFLIKEGKRVHVVDDGEKNSSRVAAGLYNPVTGRKMVRTWKASDLFDTVEEFYENLEKELGATFLEKKRIYRPFISVEEQNDWQGRSSDPKFQTFIENIHSHSLYGKWVNDDYGGLELSKSGYLRIPSFLDAYKNWLEDHDRITIDNFSSDELELKKDQIVWKDIQAKHLVYCDGIKSTKSRYFNWLPYQPLKGEIIRVKMDSDFKHIINRGVFIMEREPGVFTVGSTYNWRDPWSGASDQGLGELTDRLSQLLKTDFEIIDHVAGVRPSTQDRRPIIGSHPDEENISIFNGLGTKGVTLAPYFAKQFSDNLVSNKVLDPEVNINRFYSLY